MKRLIWIISCVLLLLALPVTAYAAGNDGGVKITVVIPQTAKETPKPEPFKPPTHYLYPVSVWESQDSEQREIIKTYELGAGEKPDDISRESFTREGWLFELTDIVKKESASADTREYVEPVEQFSATNDTASILKLFDSSYEYTNEDGYMGTMALDISTLKVETAGTKSSSYTVSATREYPNLSSNDTSLIPKTITDSGRTLTLSNIDWKTQNYAAVDYDQIPDSYTAVASYTGTAYKTSVTGYTATAEYRGTLSKIIKGKTVYTAYFLGVPIITGTVSKPSEPAPETTEGTTETPTEETPKEEPTAELPTELTVMEPETPTEPIPAETESQTETIPTIETVPTSETEPEENSFNFLPLLFAVLTGAGIGGGFVFIYLQKSKKTKEVAPHEDEEITD